MRTTLTLAALIVATACGSGEEEVSREPAPVTVRVVPAANADVRSWVYGQGTARAVRREFLTFSGQGRVTYVADLTVGSPVRAGQVIAHLEPDRVQADLASAQSELISAQAARDEAQATLELARVTQERYRVLLTQDSASQQEYDEAHARHEQALAVLQRTEAQISAAQAQVAQSRVILSESRIVSPMDGVLARLNIEQGRYFTAQTVQTGSEQGALRSVPAVVIDPSSFEIRVDLPGYAFRRMSVGGEVLVGAGAAPRAADSNDLRQGADAGPPSPEARYDVRGHVHAISPALDPETRTFEVVIRTTSGAEMLQDGEFVAVWIAQSSQEEMLAVPIEALRHRNNRPFLFVADQETGVAYEREVQLGQQGRGLVQVADGLSVGELVVTEGRARLSDGQRVRVLDSNQQGTGSPEGHIAQ